MKKNLLFIVSLLVGLFGIVGLPQYTHAADGICGSDSGPCVYDNPAYSVPVNGGCGPANW